MSKPPPTTDDILGILPLVTPEEYNQPFFDDPGGAIAQYRGWARANSELAKVVSRGASRQFFTAPVGQESAGFATRATQTVTLERTEDLDTLLVITVGELTTEGPRERVYRSTEDVIWYPFDPDGASRTAVLECELIGEPGNLDFLASANSGGLLLDPTTVDPATPTVGSPGTDVLDLQDLSQGRSGIRGVLTVVAGEFTTLTDDGGPPTFSPGDVGLYVKINAAGNPANVARLLRILEVDVSTIAGDNGSFPRTVTLDDGLQPCLVKFAKQDDGGVFTDFTAEGRSSEPDDVVILPDPAVVGDAFYFGAKVQFGLLDFSVTTQRFGELTVVWEYRNGAVWTALPGIVDTSVAFSVAGSHSITVDIDAIGPGWSVTTLDGVTAFWVRARVDTFTSMTQGPLVGRIIQHIPAPLEVDPLDTAGLGQITWSIKDWKDLGVVITEMTAPSGGRDDDLGAKLAERQIPRRPGESVEILRRRASRFPDTLAPEQIGWEINRILNPFGLAGAVCDVADGFSGLFYDVPPELAPTIVCAWDMYEPGDAFPADKTLLITSDADTRWHFFVKVPPGSLGEFGTAWDEGPPAFYDVGLGQFVVNAWDLAFYDGFPAVSASLYKDVWERVNEVRGGGIRFTMIEGEVTGCG